MRITLLFFAYLFFSYPLQGSPIPFSPIVRSYLVGDYNAGVQNWSVAQDANGNMYFGNNKGLLEYDGTHWRLYELPTRDIVRALYIGHDQKIYVGSYEEFGYFERNSFNHLVYHSLKQRVKNFRFHNDEIWSILPLGKEIVFQSFGSLFFYNGSAVEGVRVQALPLNVLQVGATHYSQQIDGGLSVFKGRERKELFARKQLGNSDVIAAAPYEEGALLLTRNSGGFIYRHGSLQQWRTECDAEFEQYTINRAVMTKDSVYVIGTISNGIYAINKRGRLLWRANSDGHLRNNTVLGLYCDADNNIWVGLDEGIAYIQNNSPIYYYEPPHRKIGMVYDVLFKEEEAYIASNQGLYRVKQGRVEPVPGLEEQAWLVKEFDGQILCGHNKGTFLLSGLQAKSVCDVKGGMSFRKLTLKDEPYLLEGSYGELSLYKADASGRWNFEHTLQGFSHMISRLEVDQQGYVWASHLRKGLFRFKIGQDLQRVEDVKSYYHLGEVKDCRLVLFKINGRVIFSNGEKFYTYEDMKDTIVPYHEMNKQLAELTRIHEVHPAYGNLYWFLNGRMAYLVKCEMNVFSIELRIPFSLFEGSSIEERASVVYSASTHSSYLCLNNVIARMQADSVLLYKSPLKRSLRISQIEAINEWSGNSERLSLRAQSQVQADMNTLLFSLSYPVYNDYDYKVRYRLEGLSQQWVEAHRGLTKRYAQLPFGSYTFRAEVYNESGVLAATHYSFEVLRPWHLSYWAIAVYVVLGAMLLFLLQYAVYQFVKKKKDRVIEHQRTAHRTAIELQEKKIMELEKEQLEAELRFKSKELSGVVMTNIAHQEFLNSLKEEIQQQKLSGQYTRKNLDKLLTLVNNNIVSDEEAWRMFQANFDRIHENFFRNLKVQYPDLTSGDLRFCALLRLNLPTKEIAKLLNISIRGVDAARYRLRKKFGLLQEDSLTDFMINFK